MEYVERNKGRMRELGREVRARESSYQWRGENKRELLPIERGESKRELLPMERRERERELGREQGKARAQERAWERARKCVE